MYRPPTHVSSNPRLFLACLLSFLTLVAPIGSVAAATLRATARSIKPEPSKGTEKQLTADQQLEAAIFKPGVAAQPLPMPVPAAILLAPSITASKVDSFSAAGDDADGDGFADPGDKITYTTTIQNAGTDASAVKFTDPIDIHTTLFGTVNTSPIANVDTYAASGNITISVAAPGVLTNDVDPDSGTNSGLTVTEVQGSAANVGAATNTTATGRLGVKGSVTLAANGGFTYEPPPGFEGADTFTYKTSDGTASDTTTVTVNVTGMVWFIQNNAGGANRGTFTNPFTTIASFNTANAATGAVPDPKSGDFIALRTGTGTYSEADGINLRNTQKLIGNSIQFSTVFTASSDSSSAYNTFATAVGSAPSIVTSAGNGVDLADSNTVRGLNVGDTGAFYDINGSAVGSPVINNVGLSGTGGAIRVSTSGTFGSNVTFSTLESTSATGGSNISLTSVTGTLGITSAGSGLAGSAASSNAITIVGGTVSMTYSGNVTKSNLGSLLNVSGGHSGTLTFNTNTLSATAGDGLQFSNADGTYNFAGTTTLNGGDAGIDVNLGSAGTFSFNANTSIVNPTNEAILISAGTQNFTYSGSFNKTNGTSGIRILNNTGGTILFNGSGVTKTITTSGANTAIDLTTNSGTTINFTNNNLLLTATGSGIGFNATGGGTITVQGTGNTITSATGSGLNVVSTSLGLAGLTFQSITVTGASNGIVLNNVGNAAGTNGGLSVTGTGSTAGSGGTISNNVQGALFTTTRDLSLKNMNFTNANSGNGSCIDIDNSTFNSGCQAAINMSSVTNATFDNLSMSGGVQVGINGRNVSGLSILNSTVQNFGDSVNENDVRLFNLTGTCAITNSNFSFAAGDPSGGEHLVDIRNDSGTLTLNVLGSPLGTSFNTFSNTQDSGTGAAGLSVTGVGPSGSAANITLNVMSSKFLKIKTAGIQTFARGDATMSVNISGGGVDANGNIFDPTFPGIGRAVDLNAQNTADLKFNINDNPKLYGNGGPAVNVFGIDTSTLEGRINSNPDIRIGPSKTGNGIFVHPEDNATGKVEILNNVLNDIGNDQGINAAVHGDNVSEFFATLDITIAGNTIAIVGKDDSGVYVSSGAFASDQTKNCAYVHNNSVNLGSPPVGHDNFGFLVFKSAATNHVYLQNFNTNATTTWNNNTNTPLNSVLDAGPAEAVPAGSPYFGVCRVPSNPTAMLRIDDSTNTYAQLNPSSSVTGTSVWTSVDAGVSARSEIQSETAATIASSKTVSVEKAAVDSRAAQTFSHHARITRRDQAVRMAPTVTPLMMSGGSVVVDGAGGAGFTLPAGKTITITFKVTLDNPPGVTFPFANGYAQVSNQGSVTYTGGPVGGVLTDDPSPPAPIVNGSSDPTVTKVDLFNSITTLGASTNSTTSSTTITFTASVAVDPANVPQPSVPTTATGKITFKDNGTNIAGCTNVDLVSGSYQCMTTLPLAGSPHSVTAVYAGDGNYDGSTSAAQVVTIINPPSISKGFSQSSIPSVGGSSTVTLTLTNPNASALTGAAFTDNLVKMSAVGGPVGGTCVGTTPNSLGAGATNLSFTGITIPASNSCTVTFAVTSSNVGDNPNSTSGVTTTQTPAAGTASNTATLTVVAPPVILKSFNPPNTTQGGNSTVTFQITNPAANTVGLTGVAFNDALPSGIKVAAVPNVQPAVSPCGGTVTAVANSGSIILSGGSIPTGGSCSISVDVTATTGGLNSVTVTSTNGGTGNTSSATLATCSQPPPNMTNWWTGDTTTRDIAGGKDGTLTGGATYGTGKVLQGFSFDGVDDYVDVGDVDLGLATGRFTVDAWINPTALGTEQAIVDKNVTATPGYFFHVTSGGALRAVVHSASGFTEYQTADAVITAGSLQHVAVTYDGGAGLGAKLLFYVNGTLTAAAVQGGQDAGGTPDDTSIATRIGRAADDTSAFAGIIDEVEFFSTVLAQPAIQQLVDSGAAGKCKPSDLRVTKAHTDPFPQGSSGNTYTITVHNDGPAITSGTTTVTDTLPAGLTATAMSGSGWTCPGPFPAPPASTTFSCTSTAAVASGSDFPAITLTVTTGVNVSSVTNSVTVSGGGELDTSDDTATNFTNLSPNADLAVGKTAAATVTAGNNLTYSITVTNNGPSDALGVSLTDTVPTNTTFVSFVQNTGATFSCSDPGPGGTGNVSCTLATMAPGTATFTLVVNVNANTPSGSTIQNDAVSATSGSADNVVANNTGTAMTNVNTSADVEITSLAGTPDPVVDGQDITYTIGFKNNGPSDAQTVTVTNAVPTNTTFVSASGPGWSIADPGFGNTGNVVFSKSPVAAGDVSSLTVVVKVNPGTPAATVISDTATAASPTDSTPGNNQKTTTNNVINSLALLVNDSGDLPDTTLDGVCDTSASPGSQCTLRAAIQEANFAATDDVINFSLPPNTVILLGSPLDAISDHVTITGPSTGVTVSGGGLYQVFNVQSAVTVRISSLTITGGQAGSGGGIYSLGDLTISNSTFTGNNAAGEGGAIDSEGGTLTIVNSTISGNSAGTDGGGVLNCGTSTAILVNDTITKNRADADGDATGNGGGIGQVSSNPLTLNNTIVAGNFVGASPATTPDDIFVYSPSIIDTANSFNNLIGDAGTSGGIIDTNNGNRVGNAGSGTINIATVINTTLANNGGPTKTHALVANSPAIDNGKDSAATGAGLTTDQRGTGFPRFVEGNHDGLATVDIGAFETGPLVVSIDDGDADNIVPLNTLMTYTVTFNVDINAATVTAADFNNAGTAAITIGSITETTPTSGIFQVQVTPTSGGTIILRIPAGAVISDPAGNNLLTPVQDDDTVNADPPPTLGNYGNTSVVFGQGTTVTPSAAPADNTPGFTVGVTASAGFTGTVSVDATTGVVTITNAGPASASAYTITVTANDGINPAVSKQFMLTVNKANTSTALQSSQNPSGINQQVTFTATVTANPPGVGVPTGQVNFLDGVTPMCTGVSLVAGVATCDFTFITTGAHSITANYLGDTNFNISTGGPLTQTVNDVTISGLKFDDLNGNGAQDAGEPGLSGVSIELYNDVNSNGTYESGTDTLKTSMLTGAGGTYSFAGMAPGKYVVREVVPSGSVQTAPAAPGTYGVDATGGGTFANKNFGNFKLITISGRKFNDLNGNGNDNGGTDPGLNGFTIELYRDINANGTFEAGTDTFISSTVTATVLGQDGKYSFINIGPGKYIVREVIPPQYVQTSPVSPGLYAVTASSGTNVAGRDFGNFRLTTTTTVTSSLTPSYFTDPVTFTAVVSANPPGSGTPTGTVTFFDGVTPICSGVMLVSGQATCTTSTLTAGSHTITAQYSGDANFAASSGGMSSAQVVKPKADVSVSKVDSPDPVNAGANLTYTILVTNNGPSTASNVVMTDTLPAGLSFVSANTSQGSCSGTATVTCTLGSLASLASATITILTQTNINIPHNTTISNTASVSNTPEDDLAPSNNSNTATTLVVSKPDMTVTKTHVGNFSQAQVGATYTIIVKNSETGPTTGVVTLTDTVPVGLTPTGPTGTVNGWSCSIGGQTLTCTRSDVLVGGASYPAISLTVNVGNPAPLSVINTAVVSGGGEVNTSNNVATDPTTITCNQDFSLNNANPLVISRFRMNGPGGPLDEFVEIFNPSTTAHTVASGNCAGGGYGVYASAGNGSNSNAASLVCYIPNGTVIPAGGYYLCTGQAYTLGNLGRNGGAAGATSTGDAPIGCNGFCSNDIPDDAGLALMNVAQGINLTPAGFAGGVADAGFIIYDKVGFGPYGPGAPAPAYPSLAGNFCEGACLRPVGDAGTGGACSNPTGLFPVYPAPPACYGLAGQYEFLRRQNGFDPAVGTVHRDTNNNTQDFILLAPNSSSNMGLGVTGLSGVTSVLGVAGPLSSAAPSDRPSTALKQAPFDGLNQLGPRNAERLYAPDPTVANVANNPLGTFALRLRFTNISPSNITGLRFKIDHVSTLCGPQTGSPVVGSGSARNLATVPDCGTGSLTAILKLLNSAEEIVIDGNNTSWPVNGTVMEDLSASATPTPPGAGPLAPTGGGLDSSLIINPSATNASVGDGVTGGSGVFATAISTTDPNNVIRLKIKFGVVQSGRFILLITPMAKTAP